MYVFIYSTYNLCVCVSPSTTCLYSAFLPPRLTAFSILPPPFPSTCLTVLLGLYPNLEELADYMGLALNSDEVQRNLALLPVADNVSVVCCGAVFS